MGRALSRDLRDHVVAAVEGGLSCRRVGERFGVSAASAIRWRQLVLAHGTPAAKTRSGDRRTWKIENHAAFILEALEQQPDPTLAELQVMLADRGVITSIATLWRFSPDTGSRAKKTGHATEQDRPDVLSREEWFERQLDLDPDRLVFIDETWASTNMAQRYRRCRRSQRLRAGIPFGHWKTTTFTAGLRRTGMVAPWVLDGPINADAFLTYVTRILVPELGPGDVVIMDNLSSHKTPAVRAAIGSIGATLLFLPPYSPTSTPSSRPSPS